MDAAATTSLAFQTRPQTIVAAGSSAGPISIVIEVQFGNPLIVDNSHMVPLTMNGMVISSSTAVNGVVILSGIALTSKGFYNIVFSCPNLLQVAAAITCR